MGKRRSTMRKKKYDDAYNREPIKPWSDLTHDALNIVMMKLEFVDFHAFSGVCKSWRSLAVCNMNMFMVSKPPMSISIYPDVNLEYYCYLEDFEGRMGKKTMLPYSTSRMCIGVTGGYLIFVSEKFRDFCLVNPITRHELHLPDVPVEAFCFIVCLRATLVFSPLICGWVFVILSTYANKIWFSIAGKQEWSHVPTSSRIIDLHGFKGKIYILDSFSGLYEMVLYPKPKLTLLEIKNLPKPAFSLLFGSSSENLYVIDYKSVHTYKIHELDSGDMNCVSLGNKEKEYAIFWGECKVSFVVLPESWGDISSQYRRYGLYNKRAKLFRADMWYFFHDFLDANCIHE